MERIEKTVFISYRRSDVYTALAVYENLKNQGFDVFFDYRSISSGDFEQIISSNIRARAHFILILTPTAVDRINKPGDWLRREIETAIDEKRNIVPLFFKGFQFRTPLSSRIFSWFRWGKSFVSHTLTGKLKDLSRYNGLNVHEDYFEEAMHRLGTEYLNKPLETVLHPVSTEVQKVVRAEQVAADEALKGMDVKKLVKQPEEERDPINIPPTKLRGQYREIERKVLSRPMLFGVLASALLFLGLLGGWLLKNRIVVTNQPTVTIAPPKPLQTLITLTATVPPTTATVATETFVGKDGMPLIAIPAGEFKMGSNSGRLDERPVHLVILDAFLIDQTEVTNAMYESCVEAGKCKPPRSDTSITQNASNQSSYYGNSKYDNYPVIFVDWSMAQTYCIWAGRRLPTEAEWEKAASWDESQEVQRVYPWGSAIDCSYANFYDDKALCVGDTVAVVSYQKGASFYGVLNMAGNVWEWVQDRYDPNYYGDSPLSNPIGPSSGDFVGARGGSFLDGASNGLRSTYRGWFKPDIASFSIGFRCALSATP